LLCWESKNSSKTNEIYKNFILRNIRLQAQGKAGRRCYQLISWESMKVYEKKVYATLQVSLLNNSKTKSHSFNCFIYYYKNMLWPLLPGMFPTEATDNINSSRDGNGDFPMKYVVETSLVQVFNVNSGWLWTEFPTLQFNCQKSN